MNTHHTTTPPTRRATLAKNKAIWRIEDNQLDTLKLIAESIKAKITTMMAKPLSVMNATEWQEDSQALADCLAMIEREENRVETWQLFEAFNRDAKENGLDGIRARTRKRFSETHDDELEIMHSISEHVFDLIGKYQELWKIGSELGMGIYAFMSPQEYEDTLFPMRVLKHDSPCPYCGGQMGFYVNEGEDELYPECLGGCCLTYEDEKTLGFVIRRN